MTVCGFKASMGLYRTYLILLLMICGGNSLFREGYFNGSSHVRLLTPVNLYGHTGLSFRTCSGGELFSQESNGNELSLYVEPIGNLKLTVNLANGRHFETRISATLLNSMWYNVNLLYHLGTLTLSVGNQTEIVANGTHNSALLSSVNLLSNTSALIVGRNFVGCILEGPNIVFNSSQTVYHNVEWGPCPLTPKNCTVPDHCSSDPCMQHGVCVSRPDGHACLCYPRYGGTNCEIDKGPPCQQNGTNPCLNSGICEEDAMGNYTCTCDIRYTGRNCEYEISLNPCETSPCRYGGTCIPVGGSYQCICLPGFTGGNCETNINECQSKPCQNGGVCRDQINNYTCQCQGTGYEGRNCENNINECEQLPCTHGRCFDNYGGYTCQCDLGYAGENCDQEIDECANNPCQNNGICSSLPGTYSCQCLAGFTGRNCETVVTNCEDMVCPTDTACIINQGIAQCVCEGGLNCTAPLTCSSTTCKNGAKCSNGPEGFVCNCSPGYTGKNCELAIESCITMHCMNGGTCMPNGECACPLGFTGLMCHLPLQCSDNSCIQISNCLNNNSGSHICTCKPGWMGQNCETRCCPDDENCESGDILCDCGTGEQCQTRMNSCMSNPCKNGGLCQNQKEGYVCICEQAYTGQNCESEINACLSAPCQNNGVCISHGNASNSSNTFECQCTSEYMGRLCEVSLMACKNVSCPEPKICVVSENGPECQCPNGFTGPMCRERVSGVCYQHPGICNKGICSDTADGYQCFCQPGFSGDHCTIDIDECLSMPCKHNATCLNQINGYNCTCSSGFTGKNCDINIDECEDQPCQYGSTCLDLEGSYECICLPGLTGKDCEINIDDCMSNPCQNNGVCIDEVNSYRCDCTNTGFYGVHCENNVDDCASDPCYHGATCEDKINNYTCHCHPGYEGKNCEIDIPECESSPCKNGGTCQEYSHLYTDQNSSLYIPEWDYQNASGYICLCPEGTTGERCEQNINECDSNPCRKGECEDQVNGYICHCYVGYEGVQCDISINECERYEPCGSHGNCTDREEGYTCECDPKYGGQNCSVELLGCRGDPCHNNGTCIPYLEDEIVHKYNCSCSKGFHGDTCEMVTTMSLTESSHVEIITDRDEGYDIRFLFKTTLPDCLLASGRGGTYYSLELLEGRLNLQTSLLNKWRGVFIGSGLNNGSWQRVFVQINTTHVVLAADQEQTIHPILSAEPANSSYSSFPETFMGNTYPEVRSIAHGRRLFVGCMEDVVVNGKWVIMENVPPNSTIERVTAGCPREPQCNPNPCNSGGKCTDKWNDFSCDCVRPFLGHKCQYNMTAATFGNENAAEGIVEVTLTNYSRRAISSIMDISMFVRTRMEKGAIFYMTSNSSQETVIAAQVESGELSVHILLNRTLESFVVSGLKLADGKSHLIQIIRNVTLMQLKINGTEYFRKTIAATGALDVQKLYLGGFPLHAHNKKNKRQVSETSQSSVMCDICYFKGVIQDVQVTNGSHTMVVEFFPLKVPDLMIPQSLGQVEFDTLSVLRGVVSDDTCHSNPCMREGICEVTWNDFECKCKRGYKGKMCEKMEFCQLQDCPLGSTCRNLENGYECIANVTFSGNNNSLHYILDHFYENGSSLNNIFLNNITLNYRSKFGGTLLYLTSPNNIEEFFSISVLKDEVTIDWRLHVGDELQSEHFKKEVPDGEWTTLAFRMENDQIMGGFQGTDGQIAHMINVNNFSLEAWNALVRGGHVYIGGASSPIQHSTEGLGVLTVNAVTESVTYRSDHTYETSMVDKPFSDDSTNFKGCVGETRIGNVLLSFLTATQLNSSNLTNEHQFSWEVDSDSDSPLHLGCTLCFDADCYYGGKCTNATHLYTCDCPEGFEGDYCETNIDECVSHTCLNNASCIDGINSYECKCLPGWSGSMCEIDINECESDPCLNEGSCIDRVNHFECICPEEFTGVQCELPRELTCANFPCKKGSTCTEVKNPKTGDNFTCICAQGFEGPRCDNAYCTVTPCVNGNCDDKAEVPICRCNPGYQGQFCEEDIDDCASVPCFKGTCIDHVNYFTCNCTNTGYEGELCQYDINECAITDIFRCGSYGICVNLPGTFMCNCTEEFCGDTCTVPNPCVDEPCENKGKCIPKCSVYSGYYCDCNGTGHSGLNCSEELPQQGSSAQNIAVIVAPIVAILCLFMAVGVSVFISMARKKRATRGTYSPSQQEYCNPRVELDNVMKPPPEERLI